jgi:plastocyanin
MRRTSSTFYLLPSLFFFAAACGSSSQPPTTPGPGGSGGSVTIITITANGADQRNVTVPLGTRIRWVNSDSRPHHMSSDPHPEHDQCPELNSNLLAPGQQHETNNLVTARTCGFHDHINPDQANLKGTIRIQ